MTHKQTAPKKPIHSRDTFHSSLTVTQQFSLWITNRVGTFGFFAAIFVWTFSWLSWNSLAPEAYRFDPFPGFVLWLFLSNVIQILLMPLIMVGQTLQGKQSEALAEADFHIDSRTADMMKQLEKESAAIQKKIDTLEKTLKASKAKK